MSNPIDALNLVSEEEKKKRLDTCEACDKSEHAAIAFMCNECGCFLHLKTLWKKSKCPIGKW